MKGRVVPLRPKARVSDDLSDRALLAACGSGDTVALGVLFRRHSRKVYRFLARMAPLDHDLLDDWVQSTFLSAQNSANRYKGNSSVLTWLLAIAGNILKNHVRGETRRRRALGMIEAMPVPPSKAPDTEYEHRQIMACIASELAVMSYKMRVVFVMCVLEGIPGCEVARTLGLRQGTVWRRLHVARKQLSAAVLTRERDCP